MPAIPWRSPPDTSKKAADELVFLDITASHKGRDIMLDVVRRTAGVVFMPLTVGGGIRSLDDIRELLKAGTDKVSISSAACRDPEFVRGRKAVRKQCIVVNIDPKRVVRDGQQVFEVHINGGRLPAGLEAVPWAKEVEALGGEIVLTSMDADGEDGYDLEITRGQRRGLSPSRQQRQHRANRSTSPMQSSSAKPTPPH